MDSTIINIGGGVKKKITLNTHAVQQKQQAARLIYEYAVGLKGYLKSYLEPCLKVILEFVCDRHSSEIRSAASLAVKPLLEGYIHAAVKLRTVSPADLQGVCITVISNLVGAIHGEMNADSRACAVEALRDSLSCIYDTGAQNEFGYRSGFCANLSSCTPGATSATPPSVCESVMQECLHQCSEAIARIQTKDAAIGSANKTDVFDASEGDLDAAQEALDEDLDVLTNITDIFGQVLKVSSGSTADRTVFMLYVEQFVGPAYLPYLLYTPDQSAFSEGTKTSLQTMSTCLICDILEFGTLNQNKKTLDSTLISANMNKIVQTLILNCSSDNLLLKQCSCYGVAQLLHHHSDFVNENSASIITALMPVLATILQNPDAKSEDNIGITENAVFCVGIICAKYSAAVQSASGNNSSQYDMLIQTFILGLPLKEDDVEFHGSCAFLLQILERMDSHVLGGEFPFLAVLVL